MIGVNDAALVPLKDFETQFFDAIRQIQLLQSNAIIYVQSILGDLQMKKTSRMVLEMAPMTCVPMAKSGRPSACTQKFIANESIAAGTPMRMIRMYSRAMGSSFSSAPLKRSRESVSSMPKTIRTTLRMRMDETTFPSTSSARSGFRSPSAREIRDYEIGRASCRERV